MELFDVQTSIALIKAMKPYQKVAFFESKDGINFVSELNKFASKDSVNALEKAIGIDIEKGATGGMSLDDVLNYNPTELTIPIDHTAEMKTLPDKRLNSDHVYRAISARILDPQQYWTKESNLCHDFRASAESIEAALLAHVGEGRVAFAETDKELLFARI